MSYLEEYCEKVINEDIVACKRVKQICNKLIHDIDNPGEWFFSEETALKHIDFIEKFCCIPSGDIGKPFRLELFQKAWLEATFGFINEAGIRKYNEVMIVCGRKNGKTSLLSAILIDMLVNDNEGAPQCVTASTMLDQSKLSFNAALRMIKQSPILSKHIRKRVSDLYFAPNMGTIRALSNNTSSLDGLDLSACVCDEMAAWKNRDTYDLLKQAMSARKQPLLFIITTNGFVRENIFDNQYQYGCDILDGKATNERFLPFFYELDEYDEWQKPEMYEKANPGLNTVKSMNYLLELVQKAKDDISFLPTLLTKEFDLPQTSETAWLRYEDLNNEELIDQTFDYCIGGFDAADSVDLNAAVALMAKPDDEKIYVKSMFWIPEEVLRQQALSGNRRGRDSVPYDLWISQGYMRTCPGNKCDKKIFLDWFIELRDQYDMYTLFIGYDPWRIDDTLLRQFKAEFGQNSMIPVRQGVMTCSQPLKNLAADFKAHRIVYDNNPVMKWNLINAEVKADVNNNIQLVHASDRRKRNDGASALMDAYKVFMDKKDSFINMN